MQVLRAKPCLTRSRLSTTQCWHPSKYTYVQHSSARLQLVFLPWLGACCLKQPTLQKDTMVVNAGERSKKGQGQESVLDGKLAGKRETQVKGLSLNCSSEVLLAFQLTLSLSQAMQLLHSMFVKSLAKSSDLKAFEVCPELSILIKSFMPASVS